MFIVEVSFSDEADLLTEIADESFLFLTDVVESDRGKPHFHVFRPDITARCFEFQVSGLVF